MTLSSGCRFHQAGVRCEEHIKSRSFGQVAGGWWEVRSRRCACVRGRERHALRSKIQRLATLRPTENAP